ncbi:ParA family protein [Nanoarchaeota archaeon]
MKKIAIINQKGGVGKTTTSINLAYGLAKDNKKVLVIDLDPQGNIGMSLNVDSEIDIYDILVNGVNPAQCYKEVIENFSVITSKETLTKAEMILVGEAKRETILRRRLEPISGFDFVIIDCPPSLGLLNQNAMLFADEIFIPSATDVLSMKGMKNMIKAIEKLNEVFDHDAKITKIIPTMFDKRNKICKKVLREMKDEYGDIVMDPIHISSKLKEAPGKGQTIFQYAGKCRGAIEYQKLVNIVLGIEYFSV